MENRQIRSETLQPIGICYFVNPRTQPGAEVRFPRPAEPVTKKHALPKPPKPQEEYRGYTYYERQRARKRAIVKQCFALTFLASFICFPWAAQILLARFGPQPSAKIIPPPPYHEGQTIKGLSTTGQYHSWVYYPKAGWVDP